MTLQLTWPEGGTLSELRVHLQADLYGPWTASAVASAAESDDGLPRQISLGSFDRRTPMSYRVEATLAGRARTPQLSDYWQTPQGKVLFLGAYLRLRLPFPPSHPVSAQRQR